MKGSHNVCFFTFRSIDPITNPPLPAIQTHTIRAPQTDGTDIGTTYFPVFSFVIRNHIVNRTSRNRMLGSCVFQPCSHMSSHWFSFPFMAGIFFQPIKLRWKPYKCEWKVKYKFNSFRGFIRKLFIFTVSHFHQRTMLWVFLLFICFKNRWSLTAIFILLLEIEFYISFLLLHLVAEIERGKWF